MRTLVLALGLLLWVPSVSAQGTCDAGATCVPASDMSAFVTLLKNQKCRSETTPKVELDSVTVVVDRQGRYYYTGNNPKPYKVHIFWCNYEIDVEAKIQLQVAQREEPTWGWRPRLKATFGVLGVEVFEANDFSDALDGGLLFEPFFLHWANLNAYVGVRSLGAGIGVDFTTNFGGYLGYALTWGKWRSNPMASFYFAF